MFPKIIRLQINAYWKVVIFLISSLIIFCLTHRSAFNSKKELSTGPPHEKPYSEPMNLFWNIMVRHFHDGEKQAQSLTPTSF